MRYGLLITLLSLSVGVQAQLLINDGYVRGMPPGQSVTAAFMQLHNVGAEAVKIESLSSGSAEKVEVHQSLQEGDRVSMQQVSELTIEAGAVFELKPNGYHLMLIGLRKTLIEDDWVELEFSFVGGGQQKVSLPVRSVLNEHVNHEHHHHH
jgi:copper(I)-binding protein